MAGEYKFDLGATLPRWAKRIGEHRYRSPWSWEGTNKWLDRTYGRWEYPRIRIINKPGIKAFHLRNRKRKGAWAGINVYQIASGEVRFYVVPRVSKKDEARKKTATGKHDKHP